MDSVRPPTGVAIPTALRGEVDTIGRHLVEQAPLYWPGVAASPSVTIRRLNMRPASRSYWLDLDWPTAKRSVIVKIPARVDRHAPAASSGVPRLIARADIATKSLREYEALSAIQRHVEALGDPRIVAVTALGYIHTMGALVAEVLDATNLRRLFKRVRRLQVGRSSPIPASVFTNAGVWLRAYHAMTLDRPVLRSRRDDIEAASERFCAYLAHATGDSRFFAGLHARFRLAVAATLPEQLPIGLTHGDFGQGNILITPNGRVGAIDTIAGWRTPIFEDIAYMFVGMRSGHAQVLTGGLAVSQRDVAKAEDQFLDGYFEGVAATREALRTFEGLLLLEKWSAETDKARTRGWVRPAWERLLHRWYRRQADVAIPR